MVNLIDLPKIMRANNWNVGADLMEHWYSPPSAIALPYKNREDTHTHDQMGVGLQTR